MLTMCIKCGQYVGWCRSPLCIYCLKKAELVVDETGEPEGKSGRRKWYAARYRYRPINCGKGCGACPHEFYVYKVWRVDGRQRERYIGPAAVQGDAYEKPKLRPTRPAFGHGR